MVILLIVLNVGVKGAKYGIRKLDFKPIFHFAFCIVISLGSLYNMMESAMGRQKIGRYIYRRERCKRWRNSWRPDASISGLWAIAHIYRNRFFTIFPMSATRLRSYKLRIATSWRLSYFSLGTHISFSDIMCVLLSFLLVA